MRRRGHVKRIVTLVQTIFEAAGFNFIIFLMDSSPFNTWVVENTLEVVRFLDFLLRAIFTEKLDKIFLNTTLGTKLSRVMVLVLWKSFI